MSSTSSPSPQSSCALTCRCPRPLRLIPSEDHVPPRGTCEPADLPQQCAAVLGSYCTGSDSHDRNRTADAGDWKEGWTEAPCADMLWAMAPASRCRARGVSALWHPCVGELAESRHQQGLEKHCRGQYFLRKGVSPFSKTTNACVPAKR